MSFDEIWAMTGEPANAANIRGHGTSSVIFVDGPQPRAAMATRSYVVKRQHEYFFRERPRPWRQRMTAYRELRNIRRLAAAGVTAPKVALYVESGDRRRAVLITERFVPSASLSGALADARGAQRRKILDRLLWTLLRMHMHRIRHGALYPDHILWTGSDIALIDMEKGRRGVTRIGCALTDLRRLFRYCPQIRLSEREAIVAGYAAVIPGFRPVFRAFERAGKPPKVAALRAPS